jgi:anthranilate phosphoribosyltransferase
LDIVLLNAGAALYVAGLAPDLKGGVALARNSVASGAAKRILETWVSRSRSFPTA